MNIPNRSLLCMGLGALLLSNPTRAWSSPPPSGPPVHDAVVLTGWLHADDLYMDDISLEVEVNGTVERVAVSEAGRFTVALPADAEATLRFAKPGHLPKEVVVDTRHAAEGDLGGRIRRVRFAVIMEQERHMGGFSYAGPVGTIGFEEGGGCLAVSRDSRLVPPGQPAPIVF